MKSKGTGNAITEGNGMRRTHVSYRNLIERICPILPGELYRQLINVGESNRTSQGVNCHLPFALLALISKLKKREINCNNMQATLSQFFTDMNSILCLTILILKMKKKTNHNVIVKIQSKRILCNIWYVICHWSHSSTLTGCG